MKLLLVTLKIVAEVPDDLDPDSIEACIDMISLSKRGDDLALPNIRWVAEGPQTIETIQEVPSFYKK